MSVLRVAVFAAVLLSTGCHRTPQFPAVRLVDLFGAAKIEGAPQGKALDPGALWDFGRPPAGTADPLLGWKAGPGVEGLKVVDGKLTGRTTTDFPILYASRPKTVDPGDAFDSVELRIRVNRGANVRATGEPAKPDFAQIVRRGRVFPWPAESPLRAGEEFQNLTLTSHIVGRMTWETFMLQPADVAGATFEIESIRAVSQRERRASIRSGIGWQGLADIYRECIVSRSPEKFTLDVDVPANAWLDLNVGMLEDHPVTFKIAEVSGNRERLLLERTLTTPHRWEPAPVELAGHSGKRSLRFWIDVPDERSIAFWGSPVIRLHAGRPPVARKAAVALGGVKPAQGTILIMCDTLRKDHLTMYGHGRDTSPNLARMASQGALFLDDVSQATWTKVATPSIMTSLYPISHRIHDFNDRLSASADTIAKVYQKAGYATVAYSSVLFTGKFTGLHQGFEELHESVSVEDPQYHAKTARAYVDRALGWIERHRDVPFFMYVHVLDPHDPFEPRPPYDSMWADPFRKEAHGKDLAQIRKGIEDPLLQGFGMPTRAEIQKAGVDPGEYVRYDQDWYDGSIRGMDAEIGRLLERIRQLGLENSIQIAFIADHGEEFIEHGRMFHGQTVYGELANVPLILYRPGAIPPGVKIRETVRSIDLMPTLLDLSGLAIPERSEGQSLVPLMAAVRDTQRTGASAQAEEAAAQALGWKPEPAVTEKAKCASNGGPPPRDTESYGIVFGGWKLVHNVQHGQNSPEFELYQHTGDPLDQKDVAAQHPEVVARLRAQLEGWRKKVEANKLPRGDSQEGLSAKDLDRLRSLGYIQ
ncbi:MAG TPA: sulfatase [Bryobacteraceae bacterium]